MKHFILQTSKVALASLIVFVGTSQAWAQEAQVGSTTYSTLSSAISAASIGSTVTLLKDVTISGGLQINKGITLDLSTYTISGTGNGSGNQTGLFLITSSSVVTIKGSAGSKIDGGSNAAFLIGYYPYTKYKNSKLTIDGDVEITGDRLAIFYGNKGESDNCVLTINSGTFSYTGRSFIYCTNSTDRVYVKGGTFNAKDNSYGLGDYNTPSGVIEITGGTFNEDCQLKPDYFGDGYSYELGEDGYYTVTHVDSYVAYYTTATIDKSGSGSDASGSYKIYKVTEGPRVFLSGETIEIKDGAAGDYYKFTVPKNASNVNINYVRTFGNTTWNAWYVPFDLNAADYSDKAEFYKVDSVVARGDSWNLSISKVDGTVSHNKIYLVRPKATGEVTFSMSNATLYKTEDATESHDSLTLTGTYTKKYTVHGVGSINWYALAGDGNFSKQTAWDANNTENRFLYPFRFFLEISNGNGAKTIGITESEGGDVTGISAVNTHAAKHDGAIYDLQGRRVTTPTKGIYIIDGKKVLVK